MEAGPGLSLFQGSESIQLNTVAQRLEEDEEQEDKKRREGEVTPLFFFSLRRIVIRVYELYLVERRHV